VWVHRHNNRLIHGYVDGLPPTEYEATFYAARRTGQLLVEFQWFEPPTEPGRGSGISLWQRGAGGGRVGLHGYLGAEHSNSLAFALIGAPVPPVHLAASTPQNGWAAVG
jgi:hypothetical protein